MEFKIGNVNCSPDHVTIIAEAGVNHLGRFYLAEDLISSAANAGADIITFHPEATEDTAKTIDLIRKEGKKVGISLKPKSKIDLVEKYLSDIDLVLIMSVEPGFGGQKFMPEVLEKTKKLKEKSFRGKIKL